ncbi:MAG: HTH domain-containing protein [bacterium]
MQLTVLVVSGDRRFRRTLKIQAGGEFHCLFTPSARRARALLRTQEVHMAVIQGDLPAAEGLKLARHIQKYHSWIPVILRMDTLPADLSVQSLALEYGVRWLFTSSVPEEKVLEALRACRNPGGTHPPEGIVQPAAPGRSRDPARESGRLNREMRLEEMRSLFMGQPQFWTCGKLAIRYGVSRQQIARDVAKLRRRGIAVHATQKGYFFDSDKKVSPTGG